MEEFYSFRKNSRKNYLLITIITLLIIGLFVIVSVHFFSNDVGEITDNIAATTLTEEDAKMLKRVSDSVVNVDNEVPNIEKVVANNIDQILTETKSNIKLGDALLTYESSKIIVVYRPIEEKVVWVLPQ